jgi:hypothetical protein
MKYKKQLKSRIREIRPGIEIGKIKSHGDSFKIFIKSVDINLRELEQELREKLSMPTLLIFPSGD